MLRAFFSSATGMRAQETLIDVTANNLANVNTSGFKRHHVDFADLLYSNDRQAGGQVTQNQTTPVGLQLGSGVRVVGTTKIFSPGSTTETNNPLDIAIEGSGFLQITRPDGTFAYTRAGALRLDVEGNLVTGDGALLTNSPQIPDRTPLENITIGVDGTVTVMVEGQPQQVGQIQLHIFRNPAGLENIGGNLLVETPASGPVQSANPGEQGFGLLRQGFLESSNVEVVRELVSLISAQRAYEINSRAIRAGDEMLSNTAQIVR
ncbi:MAG: flagellar basal-body rod protein FlgG [Planctomycetota bacterium]|nr:flagellar basal-body rod protein FlgG [Planctomycetota bacterium]